MQKKLHKFTGDSLHLSLREKCPNAELVRIQENRDKKKKMKENIKSKRLFEMLL